MRHWHRLRELLRTLFRGGRVDRDLDDELADWVETLAARHRAKGTPDPDARRLALLDLGGVEQVKEEARATRNGTELESTALDVKYAWRSLRRAPGFTMAVVLTFALGVGATTAIFSVVKTVLIEPLPYRDAGRLLFVWADLTDLGYPHAPLAGPELAELQERTTVFDQLGGVWATNATLGGVGDPEQLRIATVTPDFFPVLGVPAALGRVIGPEDFGEPVTSVLLSHSLWAESFGGDPAVVGRPITMNGRSAKVVGVMPRDFELLFPGDAAVPPDLQAWTPGSNRLAAQPRGQQYLRVVGRLKRDARVKAALDEVAAVGTAMIDANPGSYSPGTRFYAVPMQTDNVRPVRGALFAIFGGVLLLLVIACVNIAGLLVVRASARRRETMMRLAMGASRARLLRQFLVEGLMLSAIGGGLGVLVAHGAVRGLVRLAPATLGRVQATDLDPGVLAFAAITTIVWGLAFSLLPWIDVRRLDLVTAFEERSSGSGGPVAPRVRATLVVAQIALGMVLLVGAALLARTFDHLTRLDPGFRTAEALTFRVAPPYQRYPPPDAFNAFHRRLTDGLRALPSVTSVGAVSHVPFDNLPNWGTPYLPMGEVDGSLAGLADTRAMSPGFLETIGARLVAGRFFDEHDEGGAEMPVVIDDLLARRLFGDDDPVRRQFQVDLGGTGDMAVMRVIGVVGHLQLRSLAERGREQLFVSSRVWFRNPAAYVVTTSADPGLVAGPIRDLIRQIDPALPIYDVRPLADYVTVARAANRFTMLLAMTFAAVALLLACVGVYGVVAFSAARRTREFGIRLALGAESRAVVRLVIGDGVKLAAAGIAIGLVAGLAAAKLLGGQLIGVTPTDPVAFGLAAGTLALATLTACWLPARRAASVAPVDALRNEP